MKGRFSVVGLAVALGIAVSLSVVSLVYFYPSAVQKGAPITQKTPDEETTLRKLAEKLGIRIGAQIEGPGRLGMGDPSEAILAKEFNLAGAIVSMRLIQPEPGRFDFSSLDRQIRFARDNDLKLVGHRLLDDHEPAEWRPLWLKFDQPDCGGWSKEAIDQIMKRYIHAVVSRGGDDFYVWDVVNEPFRTRVALQTEGCWYRFLVEEYIVRAFRYAHEANPRVLLRLNEAFGVDGVDRTKTDNFFGLVKRLRDHGVPIHVAGIQMHLEAHKLRAAYQEEFRYFLRKALEVGVQVHVSEIDVYQGPKGFFEKPFEKQKEIFKSVLSVCLEFSHCTAFNVWGITDKYSWPRTRQFDPYPDAEPLLFDDNYNKKPAYFGVMEALREAASRRGSLDDSISRPSNLYEF